MTPEEQHQFVTRMLHSHGHGQEFKLRRMARTAAAGTSMVFPVAPPSRFNAGGAGTLAPCEFNEVRVNLLVSTGNLDIRTLLAERILRPQLRELGWDV